MTPPFRKPFAKVGKLDEKEGLEGSAKPQGLQQQAVLPFYELDVPEEDLLLVDDLNSLAQMQKILIAEIEVSPLCF